MSYSRSAFQLTFLPLLRNPQSSSSTSNRLTTGCKDTLAINFALAPIYFISIVALREISEKCHQERTP